MPVEPILAVLEALGFRDHIRLLHASPLATVAFIEQAASVLHQIEGLLISIQEKVPAIVWLQRDAVVSLSQTVAGFQVLDHQGMHRRPGVWDRGGWVLSPYDTSISSHPEVGEPWERRQLPRTSSWALRGSPLERSPCTRRSRRV
jgi:hypothetical protein